MSVAVAPLELPKKPAYKTGLAHWMEQVLAECDRAAVDFAPDPVHDLRVALRRCRSMADGWIAIDPDPAWKDMKKAGRKLFRALGELRDVQVMTEWVEKLAGADDSVGSALAAYEVLASGSLSKMRWLLCMASTGKHGCGGAMSCRDGPPGSSWAVHFSCIWRWSAG